VENPAAEKKFENIVQFYLEINHQSSLMACEMGEFMRQYAGVSRGDQFQVEISVGLSDLSDCREQCRVTASNVSKWIALGMRNSICSRDIS